MKKLIALLFAIAFVAIAVPSPAGPANTNPNNTATINIGLTIVPFAEVSTNNIHPTPPGGITPDSLYTVIPCSGLLTVHSNAPYTVSAGPVVIGTAHNATLTIDKDKNSFTSNADAGTPTSGATWTPTFTITADQGTYLQAASDYAWSITWTVVCN